jgi:hypothetical protein
VILHSKCPRALNFAAFCQCAFLLELEGGGSAQGVALLLRARPLALAHVTERALMAFVERMDWAAALALADEALERYTALPADDVLLLAQSCLRALCRLTAPQTLSCLPSVSKPGCVYTYYINSTYILYI